MESADGARSPPSSFRRADGARSPPSSVRRAGGGRSPPSGVRRADGVRSPPSSGKGQQATASGTNAAQNSACIDASKNHIVTKKISKRANESRDVNQRPQKKRFKCPRNLLRFKKQRQHLRMREKRHNAFKKKKRRGAKTIPCPVLRPYGSQVPRAPENSTQFIMDNHENSRLFYNFDSNDVAVNNDDDQLRCQHLEAYAQDEFETLYRSSHEESLMNSTVAELKTAIVNLESRCATLEHNIASRPSVLLDRLQSTLIKLQEDHRRLKQEHQQLINWTRKAKSSGSSSSSISSSSDSSSDSNSSSSSSSPSRHGSASGN